MFFRLQYRFAAHRNDSFQIGRYMSSKLSQLLFGKFKNRYPVKINEHFSNSPHRVVFFFFAKLCGMLKRPRRFIRLQPKKRRLCSIKNMFAGMSKMYRCEQRAQSMPARFCPFLLCGSHGTEAETLLHLAFRRRKSKNFLIYNAFYNERPSSRSDIKRTSILLSSQNCTFSERDHQCFNI